MCPIIVEGGYKIEVADVVSKRYRRVAIDSSERLHDKTQMLLTKWFCKIINLTKNYGRVCEYILMKLYLSLFKKWMVAYGNVHRTNYLCYI